MQSSQFSKQNMYRNTICRISQEMTNDWSIEVKQTHCCFNQLVNNNSPIVASILFLKFPADVLLLLFEFCAFFFNYIVGNLGSSKIESFVY